MSDAQLNALWAEMTRTARPGARAVFRTAAEASPLPGRVARRRAAPLALRRRAQPRARRQGPRCDLRRLPSLRVAELIMSSEALPGPELMDRVYRHQRHIYDLTRKHYLLGRDHLIDAARRRPPAAMCWSSAAAPARNLIAAAQALPGRPLPWRRHLRRDAGDGAKEHRRGRPRRPDPSGARRRHPVRPGDRSAAAFRAGVLLLQPLDDAGLAPGAGPRRVAAGAGRPPLAGRFRPAGRPPAAVPRPALRLAQDGSTSTRRPTWPMSSRRLRWTSMRRSASSTSIAATPATPRSGARVPLRSSKIDLLKFLVPSSSFGFWEWFPQPCRGPTCLGCHPTEVRLA